MPTSVHTGKYVPVENAVAHDSRVCFGITWFATEAEAEEYGKQVAEQGKTYNGGYFHGRLCGRDKTWDYVDKETGQTLYAVTD